MCYLKNTEYFVVRNTLGVVNVCYMCERAYTCEVCVQVGTRAEAKSRHLVSSSITLHRFSKTEFLTKCRTHFFARLTDEGSLGSSVSSL